MTVSTNRKAESRNEEELILLRRVVAHDRGAMTELFTLYHPRLFKFVFRLTRSVSIADEMVNDIMLLVWQKAETFRGESKVSTWIFGIAYRQTMRRVTRKQIEIADQVDVDEVATHDDVTAEREDWIVRALHALPAAQQVTTILVFYLGLSYEETANVIGCPVNTIKTRMFHARRKLKEHLESSALPSALTGENMNE